LNAWTRQGHRWLSIALTVVVGTIFAALGVGKELAFQVCFLPLVPPAPLMLSGLRMLFPPYAAGRRGAGRRA
jgi:hypothetical protein